ncbi:30S ribosomal protein S20 [Patescibacteria group bacterium]|nr:30S ribosomal protein S20 [Patescibacteria group bacterium]MBU1246364.1 30S ribosomal protein S20 [Patescibacteria group bacterium]MBU1519672.1 30S ribosomal protein S20 [Patescibacteria group bacterium]MBU1730212.1 30S ribosomal protein S20 [Patescibacteria group bacterium]MBU1956735.1 30S ribosomal protein S20 [Patescibacteria group bacterium]
MAITKGAKKAHKASLNKKVFNDRCKRAMKSAVKEMGDLIIKKDTTGAQGLVSKMYKAIDKAAKRGIIKKNTASRKKSRLVKAIQKITP